MVPIRNCDGAEPWGVRSLKAAKVQREGCCPSFFLADTWRRNAAGEIDMVRLWRERKGALGWGALALIGAAIAGIGQGCSDSGTTTGTGTSSASTASGQTTTTGVGGDMPTSSASTASSMTTTGTTMQMACTTAAKGPTRGSAIAITSDDSRLVAVNRDVGSVTVLSVDNTQNPPTLSKVAELMVGAQPWQVAIDGCDDTAYVVLRKDQKVVEITGLKGTPAVGRSVAVGSEPTSLAITPHNTKIYVSNWVDGTLSVVDPVAMSVTSTIDLNAAIVATGDLGTVTARAALAHPRGVAITNGGGADDSAPRRSLRPSGTPFEPGPRTSRERTPTRTGKGSSTKCLSRRVRRRRSTCRRSRTPASRT